MPKLWTDTVDAHRRQVRNAVLEAASALVAERGLRGVTMSEIAHRTGIGRATLYKYFPDVETILTAWHTNQVDTHLQTLVHVRDAANDPGERLRAVLMTYADISHASPGHQDVDLAARLHGDHRLAEAQAQLHAMISDLLRAAAEAGEARGDVPPDELANYCVHALDAAGALTSRSAIRRLVQVTLDGCAVPIPESS